MQLNICGWRPPPTAPLWGHDQLLPLRHGDHGDHWVHVLVSIQASLLSNRFPGINRCLLEVRVFWCFLFHMTKLMAFPANPTNQACTKGTQPPKTVDLRSTNDANVIWLLMIDQLQSSDVSWCCHPFNSTHPASQAMQPCQPWVWSLGSSGPPWLFALRADLHSTSAVAGCWTGSTEWPFCHVPSCTYMPYLIVFVDMCDSFACMVCCDLLWKSDASNMLLRLHENMFPFFFHRFTINCCIVLTAKNLKGVCSFSSTTGSIYQYW